MASSSTVRRLWPLYLAQNLPDDRSPVAVLGHKQPEMLVGFLGSVRAGHPYVPIDVAVPPQRVERILKTAGARMMLTPGRDRCHPGNAGHRATEAGAPFGTG